MGHGAACPPLERLIDAAFTVKPTTEQSDLLAHAGACAACAAELELAGAFDASPRSRAEAEEIAALTAVLEAKRALPAPPMARVIPMRPRPAAPAEQRWTGWTRLAAAALLVLSVGFALRWSGARLAPELPDGPVTDTVRSGELLLEEPSGEIEKRPAEFSWRAVSGASGYRIELRDVAGDVVLTADSQVPALSLAQADAARLESHVLYSWTVVARDAAGRELARSTPSTFHFRRE